MDPGPSLDWPLLANGLDTGMSLDELTCPSDITTRAVAVLQEARAKSGRLLGSTLARVVTAIVDASEADAVFDYVYAAAKVGRPGGGMALMEQLLGATPFELLAAKQREHRMP